MFFLVMLDFGLRISDLSSGRKRKRDPKSAIKNPKS